jgi:hypothetical protein
MFTLTPRERAEQQVVLGLVFVGDRLQDASRWCAETADWLLKANRARLVHRLTTQAREGLAVGVGVDDRLVVVSLDEHRVLRDWTDADAAQRYEDIETLSFHDEQMAAEAHAAGRGPIIERHRG